LNAAAVLVQYVRSNIECTSEAFPDATALETLKMRQATCFGHANLLVALARAAGIPARRVDGLIYDVDRHLGPVFAYHSWVELWVGDWIPADSTAELAGVEARYI